MFVNIIPAIHSIRGVDRFTYRVADDIVVQLGSVMWIPWRRGKILQHGG